MSEQLQFILVVAFGAVCFGCGALTAFIVTRNKWRDEMIKRDVAGYNSRTGNGNGGATEETEGVGSAVSTADRGEYRQAPARR